MKLLNYLIFLFSLFVVNQILVANERVIDYTNLIFDNITLDDGLPSPKIHDILQDNEGFVWFATKNGLCRFDAYKFKIYRYDPKDTCSLSNNDIRCLLEDQKEKLWIGTSHGLNVFNKKTEDFISFFYDPENDSSLWDNFINELVQDDEENIWIATRLGLNKYNTTTGTMERIDLVDLLLKNNPSLKKYEKGLSCRTLCLDDQQLWIGTWRYGLLKLDLKKMKISQFIYNKKFRYNIISNIFKDQQGMLHIGYQNKSHIIFNLKTNEVVDTLNDIHLRTGMIDHLGNIWEGTRDELRILNGQNYKMLASYSTYNENKHDLPKGSVIDVIYQDDAHNIWISTMEGVSIYYPYKNNFSEHFYRIHNDRYKDYGKTMYVDSKNNLWYGTFGDGVLLFKQDMKLYKRMVSNPKNDQSLTGNYVWDIVEDQKGNIWIGTDKGISVYNLEQGKIIKTIRKIEGKEHTLTHELIYDIYPDSRGNVWIATQEGLDVLKKDGLIHHITQEEGLSHYKVNEIIGDQKGNIWFGTYKGLSCFNPEQNRFTNYFYNPKTSSGLSNNQINDLYLGGKGNIWIGTDEGLNKLDPDNNNITYFFLEDGLIHNRIKRIYEDAKHDLWLLTPAGVSKLNPKNEEIINFDKNNGLLINYSGMYLRDSMVYFAGQTSGFYKFNTDDVMLNPWPPPIQIIDVKINGKTIHETNLDPNEQIITLNYDQSSIVFEFAALNYISPDKNQYKYKLEGFDQQWISRSSKRRFAVYNNLLPGEYTFYVIASNNNGIWNEHGASFHFKILPPWWKSIWAYGIYMFIIFSLVYLFYRLRILKKEQEKTLLQHEKDEMKLNFFTNISHEYRTPLTLIIEPLEKIISSSKIPKSMNKHLQTMFSNARRMKHLTNQIIDLRKLEEGKVKLDYIYADIIPFLENIHSSFHFMAQKNDIQYKIVHHYNTYNCLFDTHKIETILFNLLSNAFKYTPDNGTVTFEFNTGNEAPGTLNIDPIKYTDTFLYFKISNTGEQIPDHQVEKIFDKYYQTNQLAKRNYKGSGIGLSLTKELVNALNGEIFVKNQKKNLTSFVVYIPIPVKDNNIFPTEKDASSIDSKKNELQKHEADFSKEEKNHAKIEEKNHVNIRYLTDKKIMLIAEDDVEMRSFIASLFKEDFEIIEAKNGYQATRKTYKFFPDIIISDIMMEEKEDGLEFCNLIKNDEKTNHIPFILLTAKNADNSKLKGYNIGADDYIIKPFNSNILEARVENILKNRAILQDYYQKSYLLDDVSSDKKLSQQDRVNNKFMKKVKNLIYENMHQEEYSVIQLSENLNLTRNHLYRKIKSILGISPSEFIKLCRLKKAMHLIKSDENLSMSEIGYAVGFKEPSNFSRAFKDHYGVSPSNIRE